MFPVEKIGDGRSLRVWTSRGHSPPSNAIKCSEFLSRTSPIELREMRKRTRPSLNPNEALSASAETTSAWKDFKGLSFRD